jgi:hypothetical protein
MKTMRIFAISLTAAALLLTLPVSAEAASCTPGAARHAGHYYLDGVIEVGSELLLRGDGSFVPG